MQFRQLLPAEASVDIDELLASLNPGERAPEDRPYVLVNFVASVDGRATLQGRSGELGDDGDQATFHGLREQVDAVLAGTNTLRIEGYGRILGKPERRRRRAEAGGSPEPLACLVSRSGDVPTDIPLFAEPEARIALFTPTEIDVDHLAAEVIVVILDPGELTLTTVLRVLRRDYAIRSLLCEGGPTLFGSLLDEGIVDELFLTVAPKLAGGGHAPTIASGTELSYPADLSLQWLLERNGYLYHRYSVQ